MDKKKIATVVLFSVFIIGIIWIACFEGKEEGSYVKEDEPISYDEIRGVWISYLELNTFLKGKNEAEFTKNVDNIINNMKSLNLNTMIIQVRSFSDAIYKSSIFPWSYLCTGTEGRDPGFDPLKIVIEEAHSKGIRVEAWINPFRVRGKELNREISDGNPAASWIKSKSSNIITLDSGTYYNPGSQEVKELVVNGISELVKNYAVDGIHFDDYFYPSTEADIDAETYGAYLGSGGTLSLEDWRRENINELVRAVYKEIKSINSNVVFGISPQGSMSNNYNSQYIDVEKWVSNSGYVDYICPQIYYGFKNQGNNFKEALDKFSNIIKQDNIKLYIGLAAYKCGKEDTWAGEGKMEWIEEQGLLGKQIDASREAAKYGGIMFFRYDSLFNPEEGVKNKVQGEVEEIKLRLK